MQIFIAVNKPIHIFYHKNFVLYMNVTQRVLKFV